LAVEREERAMFCRILLLCGATILAVTVEAHGVDEDPSTRPASNEQVQGRGAGKDNWWDKLPRPEWSSFERIDQDQDWFEVYRIADGIYAIYEPGQFEEVISFLITGEERALLFDTGLGIGDMKRVVEQLTDLDVVVLNSHTHYDHIGGNHQFETIYARNTDYTLARAAGSPPEAVAGFLKQGWVWQPLPRDFVVEDYRSRAFSISRFVDEGDVIELGGRSLEILGTPGHAPDAICLLDRDNRLLLTGDSFYLAALYTHLGDADFLDYANTASRLAGLADDIDAALTSHNVPVVEPHYMTALGDAFAAIEDGTADDYLMTDGFREYRFDDFSIIVDSGDTVFYDCEDNPAMVASFATTEPPTVRLKRGDTLLVARQVPSASGAKYEADLGVSFWTRGNEALVEWPQGTRFNCRTRR
jgi:glyoxylase-like metal-dependent hydrolase (beta-lactamase superfamily II)/membrane-bound inhibitor of C-type lysozyme